LFTFICNESLHLFAEFNHIVSENQFWFRGDKSTIDCLFISHGLIKHFLINSKAFYCCFVDLTRAFDGLERNELWYILIKSGISWKIVELMNNLFCKIKFCVKNTINTEKRYTYLLKQENNENLKDQQNNDYFFSSKAGVFQGERLSPFLFSMYINDLSNHLQEDWVGIDKDFYITFICRWYGYIKQNKGSSASWTRFSLSILLFVGPYSQ